MLFKSIEELDKFVNEYYSYKIIISYERRHDAQDWLTEKYGRQAIRLHNTKYRYSHNKRYKWALWTLDAPNYNFWLNDKNTGIQLKLLFGGI